MQKKYIVAGAAVIALLGLVGGLTNKVIKTEESLKTEFKKSEALTVQLQEKRKELRLAKAEASASKRFLKKAARNPDGTVALDGNGNPIFETDESSSSSASSSSSSNLEGSSASASAFAAGSSGSSDLHKKKDERPATKRWQIMYGYQPRTNGHWAGAGFRQSLWVVEAAAWVGNPVAAKLQPMAGVTLSF